MILRRCSSEPTARYRHTSTTSLAGGQTQILQTANFNVGNNVMAVTGAVSYTRSSNNNNNNSNYNYNNHNHSSSTTRTTTALADNPGLPGAPVVDIVWPVIHPPMAPHSSRGAQCAAPAVFPAGGVIRDPAMTALARVASETVASSVEGDVQQVAVVSASGTASSPPLVVEVEEEEEVPTERQVFCGVASTAPTTTAPAPPRCETPATSTASGAQEPPARGTVPTTAPGTCVVCLADSEEIVGAAWLHQDSTAAVAAAAAGTGSGETDCMVSACVSCLKTYFEGIVKAGFDGACPRMRCMCCPRVVCQWAWAPLVDPAVFETFKERAATLLSLQCGSCHSRGSAMVVPPAGHSYSLALDLLIADIAANLNGHQETAEVEDVNDAKDSGSSNARVEAFRLALGRYISGEDVDVVTLYDEVEVIFSVAFGETTAKDRHLRMMDVLRCVEDNERRASLHIRFLRFHPMVDTTCCNSLHCFRCRVKGGHPSVTCEQYEAQRGHEGVHQCPGCGVYVVKGDGCDEITCVCGEDFSWDEVIHNSNVQAVSVFRAAHIDNPARAAVAILRQDSLGFGEGEFSADEVATVDEDCSQTGEDVTGAGAVSVVAHEANQIQEPVPEPVQDAPLLAPGSAQEIRLAQLFTTTYPRDTRVARAEIYGEENPHFTVHRALHQANPSRNRVAGRLGYFDRARTPTMTSNRAELEWEATAASSWVQENTHLVRGVQRREATARLSLVEAYYGNEASGDNIAHVHAAAEHSRYAMRAAAAAPCQPPLFDWLGIRTSTQNEGPHRLSSQALAYGIRVAPVASSRISEGSAGPLPPPATIWGSRPPSRFTPPRANSPPNIWTRTVSAVSLFGSQQLENGVFTWLASFEGRQRRLSHQMALEEDRMCQAWIALWGRRTLFGSAKVAAGADQDLDEQRAVQMAARRLTYLEIFPEHYCAEQEPMLKAFVRRHWVMVEQVRADVMAQRAEAWEARHSPSRSPLSSAEQGSCTQQGARCSDDGNDPSGSASGVESCCFSQSFKHGYEAYISYSARRSVPSNTQSRSFLQADGKRKRGGDVGASVEQRALDSLASAWESHNRSRIGAVRFAETHAGPGVASVAAVLVLSVVRVLIKRNLMCFCELEATAQDAMLWRQFHSEAFDAEIARVLACEEAGTKVLEGCECENHSEACSSRMACPAVVRRVLKVPKPSCYCTAEDVFDEDGFLSSLFG